MKARLRELFGFRHIPTPCPAASSIANAEERLLAFQHQRQRLRATVSAAQ